MLALPISCLIEMYQMLALGDIYFLIFPEKEFIAVWQRDCIFLLWPPEVSTHRHKYSKLGYWTEPQTGSEGMLLGKKCKLSGTPLDQNLRWNISRSFVRTVSLRGIVLVMGTNIFLSCRIRMKKFENSEDLAIVSNSISWLQISLFFIKELQLKN